jgi:hypothetical protein
LTYKAERDFKPHKVAEPDRQVQLSDRLTALATKHTNSINVQFHFSSVNDMDGLYWSNLPAVQHTPTVITF